MSKIKHCKKHTTLQLPNEFPMNIEANAAKAMRTLNIDIYFSATIPTRTPSTAEAYSKSRKMSKIPYASNINAVNIFYLLC